MHGAIVEDAYMEIGGRATQEQLPSSYREQRMEQLPSSYREQRMEQLPKKPAPLINKKGAESII